MKGDVGDIVYRPPPLSTKEEAQVGYDEVVKIYFKVSYCQEKW